MDKSEAADSTEMQRIVEARVRIGSVCEPGDVVAQCLVAVCGPVEADRLIQGLAPGPLVWADIEEALRAAGYSSPRQAYRAALARWSQRTGRVGASAVLKEMAAVGTRFVPPEDPAWPQGLADLGLSAPFGLWARGPSGAADGEAVRARLQASSRSISIVGARDATGYGRSVTHTLAAAAAEAGLTVVSGGAFGIDKQAHVSAMARARRIGADHPPTIAVLAGGIDKLYPAAHTDLLEDVCTDGLLVSEATPGAAPTRWRFLQRNRLIAALGRALVVVEARQRSGALSTANHALAIGRDVGAVPGSIEQQASAGCHQLIAESGAHLVSSPGAALRLPVDAEMQRIVPESVAARFDPGAAPPRSTDGMSEEQQAVYEATPVRAAAEIDSIARVACVPIGRARAVLGEFEMAGLVTRSAGRWVRCSRR